MTKSKKNSPLPLSLFFGTLLLGAAVSGPYLLRERSPDLAPASKLDSSLDLSNSPEKSEIAPAPIPSPARLPQIAAAPPLAARDPRWVPFEVVEDNLAVAYGDIILGQVPEGSDVARSGHYEPPAIKLWDSPEIPYAMEAGLPNPERIHQAIAYFTEHTPVRFIPRTNELDALVFQAGEEHCYSALGRTGGLQPVRLSPGCQPQQIIHELMHALGFVHEQSRPDRDQFIQVLWDNIEAKYRPQYEMVPDALMEAARGTTFDFRSVMLYRPDTFAASKGLQTLQPQAGRPSITPVTQGLSEADIQRIKRLFKVP